MNKEIEKTFIMVNMTEYALLAGLIAVAVIFGFNGAEFSINNIFGDINYAISAATNNLGQVS